MVEVNALSGVQEARSEVLVDNFDIPSLMLQVGQAAQSRRLLPKVQAQPLTQQAIVGDKLSQGAQVVLHANKEVMVLAGYGSGPGQPHLQSWEAPAWCGWWSDGSARAWAWDSSASCPDMADDRSGGLNSDEPRTSSKWTTNAKSVVILAAGPTTHGHAY